MTPLECRDRIAGRLEQVRANRHTGKIVIEIDMNQGGFGNVTFYESLQPINHRCALFSGNNGPVLLKKQI